MTSWIKKQLVNVKSLLASISSWQTDINLRGQNGDSTSLASFFFKKRVFFSLPLLLQLDFLLLKRQGQVAVTSPRLA